MTDGFLDFSGRHVFVAGGTSGINLGIARAFASHGARMTVISRSEDRVAAAVGTLRADSPDATAQGHSADVRDPEPVSYTHLTLPTTCNLCRSRWSPYH